MVIFLIAKRLECAAPAALSLEAVRGFKKSTPTAFFNTVRAFKIDKVNVGDDF